LQQEDSHHFSDLGIQAADATHTDELVASCKYPEQSIIFEVVGLDMFNVTQRVIPILNFSIRATLLCLENDFYKSFISFSTCG
jgi:hypothetical protein